MYISLVFCHISIVIEKPNIVYIAAMLFCVLFSDTILKILLGPPEIAQDHQILGVGGPLGQCFRKLISNPDLWPNWTC